MKSLLYIADINICIHRHVCDNYQKITQKVWGDYKMCLQLYRDGNEHGPISHCMTNCHQR